MYQRSPRPSGRKRGAMKERIAEILRALKLIVELGSVVEMRIPKAARRGTISGYYTDLEKMAKDAAQLSGGVEAVYFTLNPVKPALYARSADRYKEWAMQTTSDEQAVA